MMGNGPLKGVGNSACEPVSAAGSDVVSLDSLDAAVESAETRFVEENGDAAAAERLVKCYHSRARTLSELRYNDEARTDLDRAAALAQEENSDRSGVVAQILFERGMGKAAQQDLCGAVYDLEQAVRLDSKNIRTNLELAKFYNKLGDVENAKVSFRLARDLLETRSMSGPLSRDEKELYSDLHWDLGLLNISRGRFTEAANSFKRLTEDSGMRCADTYYYRGLCCLRTNDSANFEKGVEFLKKAEAYALRNDLLDHEVKGKIFFELGKVYLKSGEKKRGLFYLSRAIQEAPDNRIYSNTFTAASGIKFRLGSDLSY